MDLSNPNHLILLALGCFFGTMAVGMFLVILWGPRKFDKKVHQLFQRGSDRG